MGPQEEKIPQWEKVSVSPRTGFPDLSGFNGLGSWRTAANQSKTTSNILTWYIASFM